jgi:ACR3 family arsenite efflux pump ArsB
MKSKNIPEQAKRFGIFEKYLAIWAALCIAGGVVLGKLAPGVATHLASLAKLVKLEYHDAAPSAMKERLIILRLR